MRPFAPAALCATLGLVLVLSVGCKDDPAAPRDLSGALPDFSLLDVNPTSATSAAAVSPRDYLDEVSAWYFGHAT
ncbi:hypothetical protein KDM41_05265 [bacterium]|nr:hypothetical protein [bacterium]